MWCDSVCRHEGVKRGGAGNYNWGVEGDDTEAVPDSGDIDAPPVGGDADEFKPQEAEEYKPYEPPAEEAATAEAVEEVRPVLSPLRLPPSWPPGANCGMTAMPNLTDALSTQSSVF